MFRLRHYTSEQQVLLHRRQGVNRYEICQLLAPKLQHLTSST